MSAAEPPPSLARRLNREITAVIGIAVLVWALGWAPPWAFASLLVAAVLVATAEFVFFTGRDHAVLRLAPPLAAVSALLALVAVPNELLTAEALVLWMVAISLGFPLAWLWSRAPVTEAMPAVTAQLAASIYVGGLGATMLATFLIPDTGRRWVTLVLVSTWAGDATAYYVGRKFGKTLFAPVVSPKKTWEGAIGGGLATVLAAVLLFRGLLGQERIWILVAFGVLLAIFGQVGDLAESMLKRSAGVKDSGGLLPGHGGLLDRIDSLLWTGPLVLTVALWWEKFAPPAR